MHEHKFHNNQKISIIELNTLVLFLLSLGMHPDRGSEYSETKECFFCSHLVPNNISNLLDRQYFYVRPPKSPVMVLRIKLITAHISL